MAFVLRRVDPIQDLEETPAKPQKSFRFKQAPNIKKEQVAQAAVQNSMVGLLTQVAWLASYASEMMNGLSKEATDTCQRVIGLQKRFSSVQQFAPAFEKKITSTPLETLHSVPRTEFALPVVADACLFTKDLRPKSLQTLYTRAFAPPALDKLDKYNENGSRCLDLYTNPRFFLDEWIAEQVRLREAAKQERRKRRQDRKAQEEKQPKEAGGLGPKRPKKIDKVVYDPVTGQKISVRRGDESDGAPTNQQLNSTLRMSSGGSEGKREKAERAEREDRGASKSPSAPSVSAPPPPLPRDSPGASKVIPPAPDIPPPPDEFLAPPPPPEDFPPPPAPDYTAPGTPCCCELTAKFDTLIEPPPREVPRMQQVPAPIVKQPSAQVLPPPPSNVPAPAPPPPPSSLSGASGGGISNLANSLANASLKPVQQVAAKKPVDARSNLLEGIRRGIALKTVDTKASSSSSQPAATQSSQPASVAEILARRIAIVGSSEESEESGGEWD